MTLVFQGSRYKLTYDGMWHLDIPKTRLYDHGKVRHSTILVSLVPLNPLIWLGRSNCQKLGVSNIILISKNNNTLICESLLFIYGNIGQENVN